MKLTKRGRGLVIGLLMAGAATLGVLTPNALDLNHHNADTSTASWDADTSTDGPGGTGNYDHTLTDAQASQWSHLVCEGMTANVPLTVMEQQMANATGMPLENTAAFVEAMGNACYAH